MAPRLLSQIRSTASGFLGQLERRDVIKIAVVYVVVGLSVAEGADVFLGNLAPAWVLNTVLVLVLLGFPVSIVLAWVYDLTPHGVVPDRNASLAPASASASAAVGADQRSEPPGDRRAVAVLPFINLSSDRENEFFADGVTDDILTALTHLEGLKVTSRASSMRFKGSDKDARSIAQELGVGTILHGSVRRSAGHVRVTVQLVDAGTDGQMWAASYDRSLEDAFAVQTDIAENVARALGSRLSARGRARLGVAPTRSLEAYELVARARHAYLQVTENHVDHGMTLLRRALELDPEYAEAWAHLAIAHFVLPYFSRIAPSAIEASAREAIERAFALDDGLSEAYVARALWRFNYRFDWVGAERDFARALELNPSSADAYQWRSLMHLVRRNIAGSVDDARRSVTLDPLSFQTRSQLAQNLTWAGQSEEARRILEEIVREDPTHFVARWALGIAVRPTDPEAALGHFEKALSHMDVPLAHASRSATLRILGRSEEADRIIDELRARAKGPEYMTPFALAVALFGAGDVEGGLDCLEQGVADHDFMTLHMQLIAGAYGFEDHPRYREIRRDVWPDDFPGIP